MYAYATNHNYDYSTIHKNETLISVICVCLHTSVNHGLCIVSSPRPLPVFNVARRTLKTGRGLGDEATYMVCIFAY